MKGHIRKRGKASWAVVLDLGRDPNGRRKQRWHSVKGTRRDAERELTRLLNNLNTGEYIEPSKVLVREYLEKWLTDYAAQAVSAKTLERYRDIIDGHISPAIGGIKLAQLRPLHIQSFYTDALTSGRKNGRGGLSPQTVLHFHRLLHKALGQAVRWQLLARNLADAVEPPKPQRAEMNALDEKATATLLARLHGSRLYEPVLLALATGLRRGELLALRWKDMDLDKASLTVARSLEQTSDGLRFKTPKTERSRRTVALPAFAVESLKAYRKRQAEHRLKLGPIYEDNDLVFARDDGTAWPPDSFSTAFAAFVRRSKLPHIRFHDLRHTHATQLLKQGVHPKIVSERLGHSKVGITLDTYSHVLPGMQEDAAQRLDALFRAANEGYKP